MAHTVFGDVSVEHPRFENTATLFSVSHNDDPRHCSGDFLNTGTIVISTGAASIQTYATVETLRSLSALFAAAAAGIDAKLQNYSHSDADARQAEEPSTVAEAA